ncbi:pentapeptide repeat-containing protein [Pseudonocardiaceae bacterium YIM PH 21723]|nr:pentapeptide repeat-containing protein [Pseudonocardiaceae bacterium YIM PH 21723]
MTHDRPAISVLSLRAVTWIAAIGTLLTVAVTGLLIWFAGDGTPVDRARLAIVIVVGMVVLCLCAAGGLLLAARKIRASELGLLQSQEDLRLDYERASSEVQDRTERRVADLYGKAVELLGSGHIPVRLAGLYSLERLAQQHPDHRQSIVNVFCAYLRMPFTVIDSPTQHQEREVRLAVQRVLADHLRVGDPALPARTFWPHIDLDLTGATLIDPDFTGCQFRNARFDKASFVGDAWLSGSRFIGDAGFDGTRFGGQADFRGARFAGETWFGSARFSSGAWFGGAQFLEGAWFGAVRFNADAGFSETTFEQSAGFAGTRFTGDAWFSKAAFAGKASFAGARFCRGVEFEDSRFDTEVGFDQVRVRTDIPVSVPRTWPAEEWEVRPPRPEQAVLDGYEGEWGHLVPVSVELPEQTARQEPADSTPAGTR